MLKNYNTIPGQYAGLLYVNCQVVEAALKAAAAMPATKKSSWRRSRRSASPTRRAGRSSSITSTTWSATSTSARIGTEGAKYGLKLWNKTIKTYENVSQFWTWPEQEYLAHPVYSRDYPPADEMLNASFRGRAKRGARNP